MEIKRMGYTRVIGEPKTITISPKGKRRVWRRSMTVIEL